MKLTLSKVHVTPHDKFIRVSADFKNTNKNRVMIAHVFLRHNEFEKWYELRFENTNKEIELKTLPAVRAVCEQHVFDMLAAMHDPQSVW